MKWLIWKEYRLNRLILIVGGVLMLVPYGVALVAAWYGVGLRIPDLSQLSANLLVAALYSLILSELTVALLGGNLIACERADRSAEFQAYLPLSRARILAGKITLALITVAVIWGLNLLVALLAAQGLPEELRAKAPIAAARTVLGNMALTGFVFFSVAWMFSAMLESPTFAVFGGLVTPLVVLMGVQAVAWAFDYPLDETLGQWYQGVSLPLAVVCFVAGTWYYLRRVEP